MTDDVTVATRLTEMEIRYSQLEDLVEQLSQLVREQADQIERLTEATKQLAGRLAQGGGGDPADPQADLPPHY